MTDQHWNIKAWTSQAKWRQPWSLRNWSLQIGWLREWLRLSLGCIIAELLSLPIPASCPPFHRSWSQGDGNILHVKLHLRVASPPVTVHRSQTARVILVPLSVVRTLACSEPSLSSHCLRGFTMAQETSRDLRPTSTLTSSPPTHPLLTRLQPYPPPQTHQAHSHHETLICCLFPLPRTLLP